MFLWEVCFSAASRKPHGRMGLVLGHFGVILRVNVFAEADGQDHPQQLSIKHKHRLLAKLFEELLVDAAVPRSQPLPHRFPGPRRCL